MIINKNKSIRRIMDQNYKGKNKNQILDVVMVAQVTFI